MPPDQLTPILQRLDNEPRVFLAAEFEGGSGSWRDSLLALGLLREVEPAEFAVCRECGSGRIRRVEWLTDARTGRPEPFVPCAECGPIRISADSLRRWAVDVPKLLGDVLAAAGGRGTPEQVVRDHLWHLGRAAWAGRPREVYFARLVHNRSRPAIVAALAPRPKAVLLLPTEAAARAWGATTPNPVVSLESAVSLGPDGLTFDPGPVESRLAETGLTGTGATRKRPVPKRATRAAAIDSLTRELVAHLRAAREHALSTQEITGEPALLPRPTKRHLAELTGLSPSAVTRCFQDDTARELRLYWDLALDLDRVLRFGGPVGRGPSA